MMTKRLLGLILTVLMCIPVVPVFASESEAYMTFYVSPGGNDAASGDMQNPFRTLARAQEEVRKYNKNMKGNIVVNLLPGRYELSERLEFNMDDSGSNGYKVIWRGTNSDNLSTISGAEVVNGIWEEGDNGIWHVKAENLEFARELFVNDRAATRARSAKKIYGLEAYTSEEEYEYPHSGTTRKRNLGFYVDKSKLGLYENPEDVEFYWSSKFRAGMFHVDDIIPYDETTVIAVMDQRFWDQYANIFKDTSQINYQRGFVAENAYELLDEPGEFYFNKKTKVLSYIPRKGEDMSTAEVLCPQAEQLVYIYGENDNNLVKNIQFENIRFAHATNLLFEENSVAGGQGEQYYNPFGAYKIGRAAALVDWAEGIDFTSCVFFGLGNTALHFRNGVYNSKVIGNVFADLGASGFVAGHEDHITLGSIPDIKGLNDAAWKAGWSASYNFGETSLWAFNNLNTMRHDEQSMGVGSGWYSEPYVAEQGTYPWVRLELERAYELDSFQFSFPSNATATERSNFEVLVSNDRDFKEYKVAAIYTEAAEFNETVKIADGEKYRYIMLRKTKSEPFCLNGVWAWANDRLPQGEVGIPTDCVISNNYFTRVGNQELAVYGIWLNYTDGFELSHNEIYDVPYAAITVGWGWKEINNTARNNKINNNRIDKCMTISSDGAGIYILGRQENSEMKGNYVSNTSHYSTGLYYDQGSTGMTGSDNVVLNTGITWLCNSLLGGSSLKNTWSGDIGKYYNATNNQYVDVDSAKLFSYSNPPEDVTRIMAESGIEDEWLWIKNRIPEADTQRIHLIGPDSAENQVVKSVDGMKAITPRIDEDVATANQIIETGTFGNLPWNFDPEFKVKLPYWINAVKDDKSRTDDVYVGHVEEMVGLENAIREAYSSVYHPTYEEMLNMCDELLGKASSKDYPVSAINAFKKGIEDIKNTEYSSRGDKAVAASKLEKLYSELDAQCNNSKITSVYIEGAEAQIDVDTKNVTVKLPFGLTANEVTPLISVSACCEQAVSSDKLKISGNKTKVPLRHKTSKKYDFWTINYIEAENAHEDSLVSPSPEAWTGGNVNTTRSNVGGALVVEPWWQPTMNTKLFGSSLKFSLNAPDADVKDGIGIVFNSQTTDLELTTKQEKNTCYMLLLADQTMTLYKIVNGEWTPCVTENDVSFGYDMYNDFEITVREEYKLNRVIVKMNGDILIDTLVGEPIGEGGYFGILSKNMVVKLK